MRHGRYIIAAVAILIACGCLSPLASRPTPVSAPETGVPRVPLAEASRHRRWMKGSREPPLYPYGVPAVPVATLTKHVVSAGRPQSL